MEQVVYDRESGQNLTGSFMDYCMPRRRAGRASPLDAVPTRRNRSNRRWRGGHGRRPAADRRRAVDRRARPDRRQNRRHARDQPGASRRRCGRRGFPPPVPDRARMPGQRILIVSPGDARSGAGQFRHSLACALSRAGCGGRDRLSPTRSGPLQGQGGRGSASRTIRSGAAPLTATSLSASTKRWRAKKLRRADPELVIFSSGVSPICQYSFMEAVAAGRIPYVIVENQVSAGLFRFQATIAARFSELYREANAVVAVCRRKTWGLCGNRRRFTRPGRQGSSSTAAATSSSNHATRPCGAALRRRIGACPAGSAGRADGRQARTGQGPPLPAGGLPRRYSRRKAGSTSRCIQSGSATASSVPRLEGAIAGARCSATGSGCSVFALA